jgi:D-beta-D-heptose 7-phosphate kinase/D-beta-D-heptose 1-phosphate adenosyltransferase
MKRLEEFRRQSALVVGDLMVDRYIVGEVERISPEAPVPILRQREVKSKLGGSGNVILNVASLGAKVRAVGRIGDDSDGLFISSELQALGVDDSHVFANGQTIVKTRVVAHNQQFIRIDDETIVAPDDAIIEWIIAEIDTILDGIDVVIISDYAKGFVTEQIAQVFISAAKAKSIPILVDPKGKAGKKYRGATALTPNSHEFLELVGLAALGDEGEIKAHGLRLCDEYNFDHLILTRSEKGISVIDRARGSKNDHPAAARDIVDVTGAGDTVVSVIALALSTGFSLDECAQLANVAASLVISRFGAAQTTIEEMDLALDAGSCKMPGMVSLLADIETLRDQGKRIVFTNGCFDIVHAGHISNFQQAREFGDVLVVGVNSDESICRLKGAARPIIGLDDRMSLLSAIRYVDYVVPFDEDTPQSLIERIRPDVLVKGKDWQGKEVAGQAFVESYGGKAEFIDLEEGLSTSSVINRIKDGFAG